MVSGTLERISDFWFGAFFWDRVFGFGASCKLPDDGALYWMSGDGSGMSRVPIRENIGIYADTSMHQKVYWFSGMA